MPWSYTWDIYKHEFHWFDLTYCFIYTLDTSIKFILRYLKTESNNKSNQIGEDSNGLRHLMYCIPTYVWIPQGVLWKGATEVIICRLVYDDFVIPSSCRYIWRWFTINSKRKRKSTTADELCRRRLRTGNRQSQLWWVQLSNNLEAIQPCRLWSHACSTCIRVYCSHYVQLYIVLPVVIFSCLWYMGDVT